MEFDSVIIIGDGPIGLMQLLLIKKILNKNVTIIGKVPHRLESAIKLGADFTLLINDKNNDDNINNIFEKYKKLIKNTSSEFSPNLIFISNNNANSLNLALKLVNKNGLVIIFSGIKNQKADNNGIINIDPNFIHYNQISIFGKFLALHQKISMRQ